MKLARRFTLAMATVALVIYFAQGAKSDEPDLVPEVPVLAETVVDEETVVPDEPVVAEDTVVPDEPEGSVETVVPAESPVPAEPPVPAETATPEVIVIPDAALEPDDSEDSPMMIIPAERTPETVRIPAFDVNGQPVGTQFSEAEYRRVYRSIPFSRAEYNANPNYRHDSAMEILTGNPRTQTIVQHNHEHKQPVKRNPAPARPSRILTPFSGSSYFWYRAATWWLF